jgi:ribosomal protein S18 acetylase RimI-like enzyme
MSLIVRNCEITDFAEIFKLLEQLWIDSTLEFDSLREVFENALKSSQQRLIVGIDNKRIIGFCSLTIKNNLWQSGNLGHVDELVVDKNYRGNGHGKTLIDSITKIAKDLKCKRIELDSAFHRKEAHRFYESLGYENRAYLFSKQLD